MFNLGKGKCRSRKEAIKRSNLQQEKTKKEVRREQLEMEKKEAGQKKAKA